MNLYQLGAWEVFNLVVGKQVAVGYLKLGIAAATDPLGLIKALMTERYIKYT